MVFCRKRLFVAILLLCGCGRPPAVRYAEMGDFPALKRELDARELDDRDIRAVSRALLEHDLHRFSNVSGSDEGNRRMLALSTCAKPIASSLKDVARGNSDVAGAAAWVLVDSGVVDPDQFTDDHQDDKRPLFRAAAARGLFDASEASLRAERATDDDETVRRAAMAAAGDAGCASDFPLLLDAARRDPIAIVRVDAIRALAKIAHKLDEGAPRADLVDRLNDLWSGGDEAMRGAIARAFAVPVLFDAGGRRALDNALGREEGHATVDAASAMVGAGGTNGALALMKLARDSDIAVRAHAMRLLDPTRADHAEFLLKTMNNKGEDASLRVVAAASLTHVAPHRAKALDTLLGLVANKDKTGTDAAVALAESGDERGRARLVSDLATPSSLRFRVASALVRLGRAADVRPLLASTDIDVRDGAACAVLSTAKGA